MAMRREGDDIRLRGAGERATAHFSDIHDIHGIDAGYRLSGTTIMGHGSLPADRAGTGRSRLCLSGWFHIDCSWLHSAFNLLFPRLQAKFDGDAKLSRY